MSFTLKHGKFYDALGNTVSKQHMVEAVAQLEELFRELTTEVTTWRKVEPAAKQICQIYFDLLIESGVSEEAIQEKVEAKINEAVAEIE